MKKRNHKNRDFSYKFDNITLRDVLQKNHPIESTNNELNKSPRRINRQKDYSTWADLRESYIERMLELDPIEPSRFVWHVTYPCYDGIGDLRSFAIASEGLKVRYSQCGGAICAHNRLSAISEFYPFIIDYDSFADNFGGFPVPSNSVLYSDFWRIDTRSYRGKWYIDPNMKEDCSIYGNPHPINYICTPEDVPVYALKLYKLKMDVFLDYHKQAESEDSSLLSTSLLRPHDKVNEWVRRSRTAA